MKTNISDCEYDTLLQPTDWRFSAAATGLALYLDYFGFKHTYLNDSDFVPENAISGFDGIMYNQNDVDEEHYLLFAENHFASDMTHLEILRILEEETIEEDKIKRVNDLVKSKTVLKGLLGSVKFDGSNKAFYLSTISENRLKIIKEIFRYGKNLYADYCNTNLLLTQENPHCRLVGYNVDEGRKTKFLGFNFSKDSFVGNDILEFDFIPFAFCKTYESYFINNNYSIETLVKTKLALDDEINKVEATNPRTKLFAVLKNTNDFVNYDVEIITKSRDEDFYKTLFVRYENLSALKAIKEEHLNFKYKITDDYWMDLEKEVYGRCLNGVLLDDVIELMLKLYFAESINKSTVQFKTKNLIEINEAWKGNLLMREIDSAKKMGYLVSQELIRQKKGNKINSYKQKIIGALVAHDYDRMNEVILSLSAYIGVEFAFAYPLFEAPEENKNIAFAFANALADSTNKFQSTKEN